MTITFHLEVLSMWPSLHLYQPIAAYYWPDGEVSTAYYADVLSPGRVSHGGLPPVNPTPGGKAGQ